MQVARLDLDLPAIFQPVEATDVQFGDMTSSHPGRLRKVIFNLPVMTAGSSASSCAEQSSCILMN